MAEQTKRPAVDRNSPEYQENLIRTGRTALIGVVILTVLNLVLLLTDSDRYLLFSISVPYFLTVLGQIMDLNVQMVVLGTGDWRFEEAFRQAQSQYPGRFSAQITYSAPLSAMIYAGADIFLMPSVSEPCGLSQMIALRYGTVPIVRETGGLKDTVQPHNEFTHDGNGFTFDRYDPGLLLDAINRAKTFYFTNRYCWDEMVQRDMDKNVSWENSAWQYRNLYLELT